MHRYRTCWWLELISQGAIEEEFLRLCQIRQATGCSHHQLRRRLLFQIQNWPNLKHEGKDQQGLRYWIHWKVLWAHPWDCCVNYYDLLSPLFPAHFHYPFGEFQVEEVSHQHAHHFPQPKCNRQGLSSQAQEVSRRRRLICKCWQFGCCHACPWQLRCGPS